jgi:eukaryotic-like serine/threonine-protein kinase
VTSPRPSLLPGLEVTTNVRLLRPLSTGGMGAVWIADHLGLKTRVVVKFMLSELGASESARLRFSREAAAAAQVKSPHVVQMLDHGVSVEGVPFIVMEYLEGKDLGAVLTERGALDPADVVSIVGQVAKALSKVHAAGLLHRDIKPDNIFVVDGEEELFVKLLDFGVAKNSALDGSGPLDGETKTGQVVGTPFYMSPEQVTAQKTIDLRSDLWALGVVAFEALTGKRPFDGPSFGALAVKIVAGTIPRPSDARPDLPRSVDDWFAKACAREPSARFGSARELADGLRGAFEGVVSLPPVLSDSGPRPRLSPIVHPRVDPSAQIGLAATLGQAESSEAQRALGRSASVAVAVPSPSTSGAGTTGAGAGSRRSTVFTVALVTFAFSVLAVIAFASIRSRDGVRASASGGQTADLSAPEAPPPPDSAAHPGAVASAQAAVEGPATEHDAAAASGASGAASGKSGHLSGAHTVARPSATPHPSAHATGDPPAASAHPAPPHNDPLF